MTSVALLKVFAIYSFVMGLSMMVNDQRIKKSIEEIISSPALTFIAGLLPLCIGAILVVGYPLTLDGMNKASAMTVISYAILCAGVYRLVFTNHWIKTVRKTMAYFPIRLTGVIVSILGMYMFIISLS